MARPKQMPSMTNSTNSWLSSPSRCSSRSDRSFVHTAILASILQCRGDEGQHGSGIIELQSRTRPMLCRLPFIFAKGRVPVF